MWQAATEYGLSVACAKKQKANPEELA